MRLAQLMGTAEQWLAEPRFADDLSRGTQGVLIGERRPAWCTERRTDAVMPSLG